MTHLTLDKALASPGREYLLIRGILENVDLKNATHLTLNKEFNQSLENVDLKNLKHLTFRENYKNINEKFVDHVYKFDVRKISFFNFDCKITMVNKNKDNLTNH